MRLQLIFTITGLVIGCVIAAAPNERPVCIVGAGPSGLIVASKLETKGQNVVVFEKQSSAGGKSQSYYDTDGSYHALGALLIANATYVETLKIINQVGASTAVFQQGVDFNYNFTTGAAMEMAQPSADFVALLTSEYQRYVIYWSTVFAPFNVARYKNGVPAELAVTTAEWMATNSYQALPALFVRAMSAFGYGDIRETPILYMLTYLTPDILGFFANVNQLYVTDFHELLVRFSKTIKSPIHLSTTITKIDRSTDCPVITYKTSLGIAVQQECSSLVLAFPPNIQSLGDANLKLSANETAIFSPVLLTPYYSAAVELSKEPFGITYYIDSGSPFVTPPAFGEPISWLTQFNTSKIATVWSWGNATTTPAQVRSLLTSTLSKVNRDPRVPGAVAKPVTDADIKAFTAPVYFPHYGAADLKAGIYAKYNALQGQQNTYYVSGLDGFELVEYALRAGVDLVSTFF